MQLQGAEIPVGVAAFASEACFGVVRDGLKCKVTSDVFLNFVSRLAVHARRCEAFIIVHFPERHLYSIRYDSAKDLDLAIVLSETMLNPPFEKACM